MGELSRAFDAVQQGAPDAETALYALIRARVLDDALTACEPLLEALEAEGRHVTAAWLRAILLDERG